MPFILNSSVIRQVDHFTKSCHIDIVGNGLWVLCRRLYSIIIFVDQPFDEAFECWFRKLDLFL